MQSLNDYKIRQLSKDEKTVVERLSVMPIFIRQLFQEKKLHQTDERRFRPSEIKTLRHA